MSHYFSALIFSSWKKLPNSSTIRFFHNSCYLLRELKEIEMKFVERMRRYIVARIVFVTIGMNPIVMLSSISLDQLFTEYEQRQPWRQSISFCTGISLTHCFVFVFLFVRFPAPTFWCNYLMNLFQSKWKIIIHVPQFYNYLMSKTGWISCECQSASANSTALRKLSQSYTRSSFMFPMFLRWLGVELRTIFGHFHN